jgi:hypothetical protein
MFRASLATLLIALLAMPHGICFCELLQSAIAQKATLSNDEDTPDEHETDCPCKLRHDMASLHGTDNADLTPAHFLAVADFVPAFDITPPTAISTTLSTPFDQPITLIPCALRI